jgi:hypothetical protein
LAFERSILDASAKLKTSHSQPYNDAKANAQEESASRPGFDSADSTSEVPLESGPSASATSTVEASGPAPTTTGESAKGSGDEPELAQEPMNRAPYA